MFAYRTYLSFKIYNNVFCKKFSQFHMENIKRPFLNDLFVNRLNLDLIDYPELNSENEMNYVFNLSKNILDLSSDLKEKNIKIDELWKKFSNDGYLYINTIMSNKEFLMKNMQYLRLIENFNFNLSFALSILVQEYIASDVISMLGSDYVKSKYLSLIANGDLQPVTCFKEGLRTEELVPNKFCTIAKLSDDKTRYIINGIKTDLLNVDESKMLIVVADIHDQDQTDPAQSAAFIIDPHTPGISFFVNEKHKFELENLKSYNLKLSNVAVPAENKLSDKIDGISISNRMVTMENVFLSSLSCGMQKSILTKYCQYVNSREVFGVPLFSFDRIKNDIIDLCVDCYSSESACYFLAGSIDQDSTRDFMIESAATKTFCVEALNKWTDNFMTILSHNGLNKDHYMKMQRETRYLLFHKEPCIDIRLAIARNCVDHLLKEYEFIDYNIIKTILCYFGFYPDILCSNTDPTISSKLSSYLHPRLTIYAKTYFEKFRKVLLTLNKLRKKHGDALLHDKVFLYKLSEIIINTWILLIDISRASRAVCLYIPTYKHQFGIVTRRLNDAEKKLNFDHEELIKYFKNQNETSQKEMKLFFSDGNEQKVIPHPFDI